VSIYVDLDKTELEIEPTCNHCNYTPHDEGIFDAKQKMLTFENTIENIEQDMKKSLLENLSDPTVKDTLNLLDPTKKKIVEKFTEQNKLPESISDEFVQSLNEVLSGLEKAEIRLEELRENLQKGGLPCTQEELQKKI